MQRNKEHNAAAQGKKVGYSFQLYDVMLNPSLVASTATCIRPGQFNRIIVY